MAGLSVGERLQNLKERMHQACTAAGRNPAEVHLVAVSKLQSEAAIREAYACGQRDFAENYWQEAKTKQEHLQDLRDIRWHFIGRIQSNKAGFLPGRFFAIHSVDRLSVAVELENACKNRSIKQNVFMQVNLADEQSKGGVASEDIMPLWQVLQGSAHLRVMGLMIMPPLVEMGGQTNRPYFARGRELLFELSQKKLQDLSMGTSQDFAEAIAEGATWVRVGSDLFGPRPLEKETI